MQPDRSHEYQEALKVCVGREFMVAEMRTHAKLLVVDGEWGYYREVMSE
jgi:hypothetical protein